jgi:hypothetical protein
MRKLTAEIHWFAGFVSEITNSTNWHAIKWNHSKKVSDSAMCSDAEIVLWAIENLEPVSKQYSEFLEKVASSTIA